MPSMSATKRKGRLLHINLTFVFPYNTCYSQIFLAAIA